ncbi:tRNA A-37 threonylcarbamoyl transferase component Bud32 [Dokdonella fugitiva]|uniref:tRNA A-37 threonylcarbamoyl transferase component Bud32 n=1 Tax=Dokdonella fugitiva TaxID=328517 RepID=A0A839F1G9_9GAMM|nr:serine/threonine-protein kinase [Dokdonella fugitiva]MBA8886960.1 tRNA A-37 threonylcarbamoyl transferase component Bud32 [Dokdonella fugitiva]
MSVPGHGPDLVDRFVDGEPIDWSRATANDDALLDALYTLDQVRAAYQRIGGTPDPRGPRLFPWGPLVVQEKIGSGASAEVFRAWDAGLATPVALKLLRPEAAAAGLRSEDFLHEGRLLARISQRNVLRVYGAAVHDGRPGIWAEWIEGRTLDAIVEGDGAFADREAAHVGLELCAALAAIHAAGLVHGDVKASNVLRARGGRIVLADLGAAGTPDVLNASLRTQATPAYLSPQSRDGAPRAAADDLYALGVLLHFLLTGTYPRDGRCDLRRPGIDAGVAGAIEHALSPKPQRRPASAHAFATALRAAIGGDASAREAPVRRCRTTLIVAATALALGLAAFAAWTSRLPAWQPQAQLVHRTADGREALRDGADLRVGDRLELTLASDRPTWAYVLNEDAAGSMHVLFPLAGLRRANPLPQGEGVLPGDQDGRALSWQVSSEGGREEFVVVLADAPLARLEERLAALDAAAIDAPQRGVARISGEPLANVSVQGRQLAALLSAASAELADARHVRVLAYHFETRASR